MNTLLRQPRINPLTPPYRPGVETMLTKMMPPGFEVEPLKLFRVLAHHIDLANRMRPLYAGILAHGLVEDAERELVILRTCARCGAEYEWGVHAASFGKLLNTPDAKIWATVTASAEDEIWTAREALLIRLADELHDNATVSDALWNGLVLHWNEAQLIELLMIAGLYHTISFIVNGTSVSLESWGTRFPKL